MAERHIFLSAKRLRDTHSREYDYTNTQVLWYTRSRLKVAREEARRRRDQREREFRVAWRTEQLEDNSRELVGQSVWPHSNISRRIVRFGEKDPLFVLRVVDCSVDQTEVKGD